MKNMNGRILYEGPSKIDQEPIVCIATGFLNTSRNKKTGDMIQTWIMRQDINPLLAFYGEESRSVCGDCTHRGTSCYVNWGKAPSNVWKCWKHGSGYPEAKPTDFAGRFLRLGSAGDPAAVPIDVWASLLPYIKGRTGYTHQWKNPEFYWFKYLVQASCDTFEEYQQARAAHWRTFTVLPIGEPDPVGTTHCPASEEAGRKTTCDACRLCDGGSAHVAITVHGRTAKKYNWPSLELVSS